MSTLVLDDATVQSVFDWKMAVAALRDAYAADSEPSRFPPRVLARGGSGLLRTLSGVPANAGLMGTKTIAGALGERRMFSYLISLFDPTTAELVALLDGNSITGYRTAATSALAADLLCPPGALDVAVIGSGFEARKHLEALTAVRTLTSVTVFSPRAESRARFAHDLGHTASVVQPSSSPQEAVADASLVICAARSYDETPTLCGAWLKPGSTVVSIGSTLRDQREVDTDTIARADVIVADMVDEVVHDSGDLLAASAAGIDVSDHVKSLADIVSGRQPGRVHPRQNVLYKSVGSAVQDLAVAAMCVAAAEKASVGVELPIHIRPVQK
ncbi:ornithine cyclodeaminase family protein [Gordonia sp. CPCC 205515]|uniref:ornithine cyclodeaminase family protein n=1 Tax=Gordonia sp. CPCC 205515 TaxID=3140791 RepID=UPI003AF379FA